MKKERERFRKTKRERLCFYNCAAPKQSTAKPYKKVLVGYDALSVN